MENSSYFTADSTISRSLEAPYPQESQIRAEVHRVVDTLAHGGGLIIEMRNSSTALNGTDVSAILYDEFARYTKNLYSADGRA